MTGFTAMGSRRTEIYGTRGEIRGDGRLIHVHDFLTDSTETLDTSATGAMSADGGHGGGDVGLMDAFVAAVAAGDPAPVRSGPRESLLSHLAVLAAERSRLDGTVVDLHAHL